MSAHTCEHDHNMIESILEYDAYYHDALFLAVQDECVTCVEHVLRYIEHIHPDDARECKYDLEILNATGNCGIADAGFAACKKLRILHPWSNPRITKILHTSLMIPRSFRDDA